MPEKKAERPEGQMRRRPMRRRKKVCAFCADANKALDYKDGKGVCAESPFQGNQESVFGRESAGICRTTAGP